MLESLVKATVEFDRGARRSCARCVRPSFMPLLWRSDMRPGACFASGSCGWANQSAFEALFWQQVARVRWSRRRVNWRSDLADRPTLGSMRSLENEARLRHASSTTSVRKRLVWSGPRTQDTLHAFFVSSPERTMLRICRMWPYIDVIRSVPAGDAHRSPS